MFWVYIKMKKRKEKKSAFLLFLSLFFGVAGLMIALLLIRSMKMGELTESLKAWGNYDFSFYNVSDKLENQLAEDEHIGELGIVYEFKDSVEENSHQTITIGAMKDEVAENLFYAPTIKGHYPTAKDEICIDRLTLKRCGLSDQIGEKITLCINDKDSSKTMKREYILSGIMELNETDATGATWCRRKVAVEGAKKYLNGTDSSESVDFPMAYLYVDEAIKSLEVVKRHCFVNLKNLDEKGRQSFYHTYYSKKWEEDFDFDNNTELFLRTARKIELIHQVTFGNVEQTEDYANEIMQSIICMD